MTDTLPIYDTLTAERYSGPNAIQRDPTPSGGTVNLLADIRAEFGRAVTWTEDEFRAALPTVARLADTADAVANSGAAKAVLDAVLTPADEAIIVGLVNRLDQGIHQAEADTGEAPADVPEAPAESESVFEPQAGPVVGGQAQ